LSLAGEQRLAALPKKFFFSRFDSLPSRQGPGLPERSRGLGVFKVREEKEKY
jgi:hypothetical protein